MGPFTGGGFNDACREHRDDLSSGLLSHGGALTVRHQAYRRSSALQVIPVFRSFDIIKVTVPRRSVFLEHSENLGLQILILYVR